MHPLIPSHPFSYRAVEVVKLLFNFRFYIRLQVTRTSLNNLRIYTGGWHVYRLKMYIMIQVNNPIKPSHSSSVLSLTSVC